MNHYDSLDQITYINAYTRFINKLEIKIKKHNCVILPPNVLLSNIDLQNCSIVLLAFGDECINITTLHEMVEIANAQNLSFNIITDLVYNTDFESDVVKVIFFKEFLGVYYLDHSIKNITSYKKLYNSLNQRVTLPRLHQFCEIMREEELKNLGYVSLLGFQIYENNKTPIDVVNDINENSEGIYSDILDEIEIPFRNFNEPADLCDLEVLTKYSIVHETYNHSHNIELYVFTEKTFRSLQVENISLLENKSGSVEILADMGFKFHPINHVLDAMLDYDMQIKFIIQLLKHDMFGTEDVVDNARHNQELLKKWLHTLNSNEFMDNIIDEII